MKNFGYICAICVMCLGGYFLLPYLNEISDYRNRKYAFQYLKKEAIKTGVEFNDKEKDTIREHPWKKTRNKIRVILSSILIITGFILLSFYPE